MTLIEEIQAEAVDGKSDLGTLLRKCKLLAARLGSDSLENWLLWESNGYPSDARVPDYRIWPLELKGHFAGVFGAAIRNAPIPRICLPERLRGAYKEYECRQSVASIEDTVKKHDNGMLYVTTNDLSVILGDKVYQNYSCVQAWAEFGVGQLVEVLNTVRNRVLDFSLAIWKESPNAGDLGNGDTIAPGRVKQIFNTTVYGGVANLVGSAKNSMINFDISQGNFDSLSKVLRDNGIQDADVQDLKSAIQTDGQPKSAQGFGPKVSTWIASMIQKAAQGSWQIAIGAAGTLLAEAISKYYGL